MVDWSSSLTFVPLAVGADLVGFKLDKALEGRCVLRRPLGGRVRCSSRHLVAIDSLPLDEPRTADIDSSSRCLDK